MEQSSQPQTLGYSLADSPSGLLAWIYEKLVNWTDGYKWDDDEGRFRLSSQLLVPLINIVLTWISIYWFSRAGPTASLRIYYEFFQGKDRRFAESAEQPTIPLGFSFFPKELYVVPKAWVSVPSFIRLSLTHLFTAIDGPGDTAMLSSTRNMKAEGTSQHMKNRRSFAKI